jgi:hypothetical protein
VSRLVLVEDIIRVSGRSPYVSDAIANFSDIDVVLPWYR